MMLKIRLMVCMLAVLLFGLYGGAANAQESQTQKAPLGIAQAITARVVINGTVSTFDGYALKDEYYFTEADILSVLSDASLTQVDTMEQNGVDYYALQTVAEQMGYNFAHDDVLRSDYIWTYPGYDWLRCRLCGADDGGISRRNVEC